MTGIVKNIKRSGRGETKRYEPLPDHAQAAIHTLLGNLQILVEHRLNKDKKNYRLALNSIPEDYRHCYHELIVLGAEYTVISFDIRRGQEGIAYLLKDHFQLVEKDGYKFLQKVRILSFLG